MTIKPYVDQLRSILSNLDDSNHDAIMEQCTTLLKGLKEDAYKEGYNDGYDDCVIDKLTQS